jgi:hypothetical protein
MRSPLEMALYATHLMSAAGWFGALFYRAFFVEPKAKRFFTSEADYERFTMHLADGMRSTVFAALLTCGLSGFGLVGYHWDSAPAGWGLLMTAKVVAWVAAFSVFGYISWVFFPRRVFAVQAEYPRVRRQGFYLALVMIGLAGLGIVLGMAGRFLA